MFKGPENDINLHVFSERCPEVTRMLAFRDSLKINEADRELYTSASERWVSSSVNTHNYADSKSPVVKEILTRARGPSSRARLTRSLQVDESRADKCFSHGFQILGSYGWSSDIGTPGPDVPPHPVLRRPCH
jgi:hypothetical protein